MIKIYTYENAVVENNDKEYKPDDPGGFALHPGTMTILFSDAYFNETKVMFNACEGQNRPMELTGTS
jgi:hypothetical protein